MTIVRMRLIAALVAASCSGCQVFHVANDAMTAGPRINDNVFMGRNGGADDPYDKIPSVIPLACQRSDEAGGNNKSNEEIETYINKLRSDKPKSDDDLVNGYGITKCVDAMKLLIDTRWARFEHSLNASISTSNYLVDTSIMGLTTSIPLVAPGTAKVLGAIAAGLTGTRKSFDEDVLYSYSLQTIMQQMRTDRAKQEGVIDNRLNGKPRPYRNMFEAAADLFEYDQAGGWDHAMASLQANVAAQTAACLARLRDQKMDKPTDKLPDGQTPTSTATDPCNAPPVKADADSSKDTDATAIGAAASNDATIEFSGGEILASNAVALIAKIAKTINDGLKAGTIKSVSVQGQADARGGTDDSNTTLAHKRAALIMAKLIDAGVPSGKIAPADPAIALRTKRAAVISYVK